MLDPQKNKVGKLAANATKCVVESYGTMRRRLRFNC